MPGGLVRVRNILRSYTVDAADIRDIGYGKAIYTAGRHYDGLLTLESREMQLKKVVREAGTVCYKYWR